MDPQSFILPLPARRTTPPTGKGPEYGFVIQSRLRVNFFSVVFHAFTVSPTSLQTIGFDIDSKNSSPCLNLQPSSAAGRILQESDDVYSFEIACITSKIKDCRSNVIEESENAAPKLDYIPNGVQVR